MKARRNAFGYASEAKQEIFNLIFTPKVLVNYISRADRIDFDKDPVLIVLSVLSDSKGMIEWITVNPDTILTEKITSYELLHNIGGIKNVLCMEGSRLSAAQNTNMVRRNDIRPVIIKNGKYMTVKNYVLTECFIIKSSLGNYNRMNSINIKGTVYSKRETIEKMYYKQNTLELKDKLLCKYILQGKIGDDYEFWSIPPMVIHGDFLYYGIGEFLYRPGIGIISGKNSNYYEISSSDPRDSFFEVVSIDGVPVK